MTGAASSQETIPAVPPAVAAGAGDAPPTVPEHYRRTVLANYAHAAVLALVALAITPVLARWLGRTEFGIWVLIGSIAAYLELLELGVGGATVRELAFHDARGDDRGVRRTLATSFWLLVGVGVLALVGSIVLAVVFPLVFDVPASLETPAAIACLLVAGSLAVSIPADVFGGALIAYQRYDLLNATLVATLIAQAIGWVVALALGGGLVALAVVTAGFALAGQAARWWLARRVVTGLSLSPRLFERSRVVPLARLSIWFSLSQVAWLVTTRIDVVVVGVLIGVPEAAVYAVGQKLALSCTMLVSPLTDAFFPLASALEGRADRPRLRGAIVTGTRISLAVALPLSLTVALLAGPGVEAWVGDGFEDAAVVAALLAANAALRTLPSVGIRALAGSGAFRGPSVAFVCEAVLNLGASVALGRELGLAGVALGSLIASAVIQIGYVFPLVARRFELPLGAFLRRELRAHLPAAAATTALGVGMLALGVHGVGPVLAAGVAMVLCYVAVLAVTGLEPGERHRVASALRRRSRPGTAVASALLVDPSDRGGLVAHTTLLARALAEAGCDATVVANRAVDPSAIPAGTLTVLPAARWGRDRAGVLGRARAAMRWLRGAWTVAWLTIRRRPDVVHFQAPLNRRFDPLLVRLLRVLAPVVLTAHDVLPHEAAGGEEGRWTRLYRSLDAIVALTRPAADAIEQLSGRRVAVIGHPSPPPAGIDRLQARDALGLPAGDRVLGALGFIRAYKGYDLLADVWERLGPAAPLLLVRGEPIGDGEHDTVARLDRCPRTIVELGYVTDAELGRAVAACDALLLPYRGGSDSGLVHLARAHGVPVLASDAAELAASVHSTETGVVLPRDVDIWASAVLGPLPPPPRPGPSLVSSGRAYLAVYESARASWSA